MDDFYNQQYGQSERQDSVHDDAMSGMDMSQSHAKDMFGPQSSGQVSTGIQKVVTLKSRKDGRNVTRQGDL